MALQVGTERTVPLLGKKPAGQPQGTFRKTASKGAQTEGLGAQATAKLNSRAKPLTTSAGGICPASRRKSPARVFRRRRQEASGKPKSGSASKRIFPTPGLGLIRYGGALGIISPFFRKLWPWHWKETDSAPWEWVCPLMRRLLGFLLGCRPLQRATRSRHRRRNYSSHFTGDSYTKLFRTSDLSGWASSTIVTAAAAGKLIDGTLAEHDGRFDRQLGCFPDENQRCGRETLSVRQP